MSSLEASSLFNVKGMAFVITGGGTGIGKMMAKALDINGAAKVYIVGRRKEVLDEVAKEAVAIQKNGSIVAIKGDVTSNDSLAAIASQVQKEVGYVNVVIANSGVSGPSITGISNRKPPASVEELQDYLWKWKPEDFDSTFTINVRGTFFTMVAFLKLLDAGNSHEKSVTVSQGIRSQFIATSSLAGLSRKITMGPAYSASKAATNHLIKMLATYLIPYQIRANVICPGLYPSEMTAGHIPDNAENEGSLPIEVVPLRRAGTEEDMAGAILSLCGRGGAYYNGMIVLTDGGRTSGLPASY